MSEATILVHPSDRLGDGLPTVLREAMALGTPVIASRIAGIPEALDDGRCGLLVPSGDLEALADAIARLLQHAIASARDRKSTRLNSSHSQISYAVFCLKKKKHKHNPQRVTASNTRLDYRFPSARRA